MAKRGWIGAALGICGIVGVVAKCIFDSANSEPEKYSSNWFKSVSDEALNSEREIVRKQFCSAGGDFSLATRLQNLLYAFDRELSKRAWGDEKPHAPSIHREHGWYLSNDD